MADATSFADSEPKCKPGQEAVLEKDIEKVEQGQHPQDGREIPRSTYSRHIIMLLGILILTALRFFTPGWLAPGPKNEGLQIDYQRVRVPDRPNFIFIMTDDQDLHMSSIQYQPSVQKHFAEEGTFFSKHYCTIAICCPSRVSLLTGKAAHKYTHPTTRL